MDDINFKEIDENTRFHYREEREASAHALGYTYVSEAFYDLFYNQKKPLSEIYPLFGYTSRAGIASLFAKYGWRLGQRGGFRKFDNIFPHIAELRKELKEWKETVRDEKFITFCGRLSTKYKISKLSIYALLRGKTWKNIS